MRICLFSDTHGNLLALEAVLADMQRQGTFDLTVMAGDLAMLGPRPAETIDLLRTQNCLIITGNTDRMIVERANPLAVWAAERIGQARLDFLAGLPFAYSVQPAPGRELFIFHATPRDLNDDLSPKRSDTELQARIAGVTAELLAFGHIHIPYVRRIGNHTLFDIASAGLPRDGDQRAVYAIAEWTGSDWQLAHHRVAYDVDAVAADLRASGMPNAERQIEILLSASY